MAGRLAGGSAVGEDMAVAGGRRCRPGSGAAAPIPASTKIDVKLPTGLRLRGVGGRNRALHAAGGVRRVVFWRGPPELDVIQVMLYLNKVPTAQPMRKHFVADRRLDHENNQRLPCLATDPT